MFPPDRKLYPTYDDWLETSMRAEPVEFFREMLAQNLPIDHFVDSDWTVVNARLCDFYGLPEPKSGDFQRVSLQPENRRGGLMKMGADPWAELRWHAPSPSSPWGLAQRGDFQQNAASTTGERGSD